MGNNKLELYTPNKEQLEKSIRYAQANLKAREEEYISERNASQKRLYDQILSSKIAECCAAQYLGGEPDFQIWTEDQRKQHGFDQDLPNVAHVKSYQPNRYPESYVFNIADPLIKSSNEIVALVLVFSDLQCIYRGACNMELLRPFLMPPILAKHQETKLVLYYEDIKSYLSW